MSRTAARPNKVFVPQIHQEEAPLAESDNFSAGFISDQDPARLPLNALTVADNVTYIRGMLLRRNGLNVYSLTLPNSNKVLNLYAANHTVAGLSIFRFDKQKIYVARSTGWVEIVPSGIAANSGGDFDYFSFVSGDDRIFFCNGVDPIREIDPVALTYKALGNAPIYKYITMAFDRLVGANRVNVTNVPFEVGWSGRLNYGEWNPVTDISAGSTPLVDSPSDSSDDITGICSAGNILCVPRERSTWIGGHTNSATNPFNFISVPVLAKIGADIPRTIQLSDNHGLIWYNAAKNEVYTWELGSWEKPKELAEGKVSRYLKQLLKNAIEVWAAYSPDTETYSIYYRYASTSIVSVITYNFDEGNWVNEYFQYNPSCIADLDFAASSITINELTGTINALLGSIDELGGLVANSTRFIGYANGTISTAPTYSGLSTELADIVLTDNFATFSTTITHKPIEVPITDTFINIVRISVTPFSAGTIRLLYSKDDGLSFTALKDITFGPTDLARSKLILRKKSIKARRFIWRIDTSDCMFALNSFAVKAITAGVSK